MEKAKNIQISTDLFEGMMYLLENIDDFKKDDPDYKFVFDGVFKAMQEKKKAMERREDYQRLITANKSGNESEQIGARIEYLKKK